MPDYIEPIPAQGQTDWPAMLHDLEKRVEVLSDSLEGVKLSMRRLVLAEPWLEQAITSFAVEQPEHPAHLEPVAMAGPEQPVAYEAPPVYNDTPVYDQAPAYNFEPPVVEAAPPAEVASPVSYDDDAREAVRRAVEEAKAQMASGHVRKQTDDYVTEDKPDVSWVTVPDDGSAPVPLPVFDEPVVEPEAEHAPEEDAHEAVRRAVEQMNAEMSSGNLPPAESTPVVESPAEEPEDPHEAVRRAVEQMKAEMSSGSLSSAESMPPAVDAQAEEPEDPREAVRRAVEQTKADLGMPGYARPQFETREEPAAAAVSEDEAAREAVRQAVEEAKAERNFAENAIGTMDEEEAAREAVRQAVAKARTEMATTGSISEHEPEPVAKPAAFMVPPPHRAERIHPPTITIEDPEGRVELARVYNLLKRLDVAANSSLLNYSSRQVSVQLGDSKTAPEGDTVGTAVREVFERENDVSVDGLNVIVKLGNDDVQAA